MGIVTMIQFWRGKRADLPLVAPDGAPMWCWDARELWIGTGTGRAFMCKGEEPPEDDPGQGQVSDLETLDGAYCITLEGRGLTAFKPKPKVVSRFANLAGRQAVTLSGLGLTIQPQPAPIASTLKTGRGAKVTTLSGLGLSTLDEPAVQSRVHTLSGAQAKTLSGANLTYSGA